MKIEIAGSIKVMKNGEAFVSMLIGVEDPGPRPGLFNVKRLARLPITRMIPMPMEATDMPAEGWESAINSKLPYRMASMCGDPNKTYWLCSDKLIRMTECAHLTEEEQKLETAHFVLRHERRFKKLRQQLEAYRNLERAEASRREQISDAVRLFVWQRDEGKCVKCGSKERLEFDHIIPIALGGSNTERNIQLLCEACNRSKGTNV